MYQVIARKYRPQSFQELIGQEHVRTTLENAIVQRRIAHGYVLSGQRGTGKTTVARIVARCLNCEQGPTNNPCGVCPSCLEIAAGGAVDVIEIDAASNRGINEMRELRENIRYRPARDRYKVFIVDEAHQITNEAFNALLKTLEEPPEWVVFLLCTTEVHKIPSTIASRCQMFSFRSVDFAELVERMAWICEQEGIQAEPDALAVLAQAGEGSVRDSLSALDQAIACCGSMLKAAEVRSLLGMFSLESLHAVTRALSDSDSRKMLEIVFELERNGHNLQHFCRELARYFRNLLVARIAGQDSRLIPAAPSDQESLAQVAGRFSEEDLTRYLQLTLDLFRDLQHSLQPRLHLELGLLRLIHAGKLVAIEEVLASLGSGSPPSSGQPGTERRTAGPSASTAQKSPPARSGPSPFAADVARRSSPPPAPPEAPPVRPRAEPPAVRNQSESPAPSPERNPQTAAAPRLPSGPPAGDAEWKEKLHALLLERDLTFIADAVEHAHLAESGGDLVITAPPEFSLALRSSDLQKAVQHLAGRPVKTRISIGEGSEGGTSTPVARKSPEEDEVSRRAMEHPDVRRFQELFPGSHVRNVRNLKE